MTVHSLSITDTDICHSVKESRHFLCFTERPVLHIVLIALKHIKTMPNTISFFQFLSSPGTVFEEIDTNGITGINGSEQKSAEKICSFLFFDLFSVFPSLRLRRHLFFYGAFLQFRSAESGTVSDCKKVSRSNALLL